MQWFSGFILVPSTLNKLVILGQAIPCDDRYVVMEVRRFL